MLRTAEKKRKKDQARGPQTSLKREPVPKTGFDPSKSFDEGRFCLTNFRASFLSFLARPERPREAKKRRENSDGEGRTLRRISL